PPPPAQHVPNREAAPRQGGTSPPPFAFLACQRGSLMRARQAFLLLRFFAPARRRLPPHRSSRCPRARFCRRMAASTRFDGVTATIGAFSGASAATLSVAVTRMLSAQPVGHAAGIARPLPRARRFSGSILSVAADG